MSALSTAATPDLTALLREMVDQAVSSRTAPSKQLDEHAGRLVQEFLDEKGWSARDLATQTELVAERFAKPSMTASRKTVDRVLKGHVPRSRIKAAIALVMGVPPWKVWGDGQMPLAHQREQIVNASRIEVAG